MTITLHWWLIPIALIVAGIVIGTRLGKPKGDWDFSSPFFGGVIIVAGFLAALFFLIGRWLR